jgi:hypothetical protein
MNRAAQDDVATIHLVVGFVGMGREATPLPAG